MNNITIELCAEDRARIDKLIEAMESVANRPAGAIPAATEALKKATKSAKEAAAKVAEPEPEQKAPAKAEPAAPVEPEPEKTEAVPEVSTGELQNKVVQLVGAGKKDAARAIIQEYAPNVSSVPAEKRAEVLERLKALEG